MLTEFLKKRKEKLKDIEQRSGDPFYVNPGQEGDPRCMYCIQYRLLFSRTVVKVYLGAMIDNT